MMNKKVTMKEVRAMNDNALNSYVAVLLECPTGQTPDWIGDLNAAWRLGDSFYLDVVRFANEDEVLATISENENSGDLPFFSEKSNGPARAIVLAFVAMKLGTCV